MNWYTEKTVKYWPHYNIIVGLVNIVYWFPNILYWAYPLLYSFVNTILGILSVYWGIQGLRHHYAMKKRLTKSKSPV